MFMGVCNVKWAVTKMVILYLEALNPKPPNPKGSRFKKHLSY